MKVAHEEQRDPGDAFKRAAIGFYLAHHLKLAGFFPPESDYMTESSSSNKDGFFSVKNQTVVTIVTLLVSNDEILVTGFHFFCAVLKIWAAGSCCVQGGGRAPQDFERSGNQSGQIFPYILLLGPWDFWTILRPW